MSVQYKEFQDNRLRVCARMQKRVLMNVRLGIYDPNLNKTTLLEVVSMYLACSSMD